MAKLSEAQEFAVKLTRYSRGGRRIFHGKHFQSHLEELAIICPFKDIEHKFYLTNQ